MSLKAVAAFLGALVAAFAAGLIESGTFAQATVKPVAGTDVGLEGDPDNSIVVRAKATNQDGVVTFSNLKPGRYVVVLTNTSALAGPCRVSVEGGATKALVSEPIPASRAGGKAYAMDKNGRKLTLEVPASGGTIRVNVSADVATPSASPGNRR